MSVTPNKSVISSPILFRIICHSHNIRSFTNKRTKHLRLIEIRKCLFNRISLGKNTGPSYPPVMILCACQCLLFGHVTISPYRITAVFPGFCTVAIQNRQTVVVKYCTGKVEGTFRVIAILVSGCRITKSGLISPLLDIPE